MIALSRDDARRLLIAHCALERPLATTRQVLDRLRCIQLDPLDPIGTNADLVVMARVDKVRRGDVWRDLFPRHAFEHFAKERCILPASAFPWYRAHWHTAQAPWWRHAEREERLPKSVLDAVLAEVRERGPITAKELTDHGAIEPIDWSGWTGTARATTMALEVLWTRCDIVVAGRTESGAKMYSVPRFPGSSGPPVNASEEPRSPRNRGTFEEWALRERVIAAGLLARAGGSTWSMLSDVRTSPVPDAMIARGELVDVAIEGSPRRCLATPEFLRRRAGRYDDRVRILGPLDPLLWDRNLVRHLFDFEYVWEVYKPAALRKWGWYICPLLWRDRLAGRIDAAIERGALVVRKLWIEDDDVPLDAINAALQRHADACGVRVGAVRRIVRSAPASAAASSGGKFTARRRFGNIIPPRMRDLDLGGGIVVPESLLRAVTSRSGGPGGQNVNKLETRVTIEVDVDALPLPDETKAKIRERLAGRINRDGVLRVTSQAERTQLANRDRALARLEELLRDALAERKPRRKTRVSKAAKEKRLQEKKRRGKQKRLRGGAEQ